MTAARMDSKNRPVFIVSHLGPRRLTPGIRLGVELEQNVQDRFGANRGPGPWPCDRAEVLADGRLATTPSAGDAGRHAAALLEADILDVVLVGPRPVVRLR